MVFSVFQDWSRRDLRSTLELEVRWNSSLLRPNPIGDIFDHLCKVLQEQLIA